MTKQDYVKFARLFKNQWSFVEEYDSSHRFMFNVLLDGVVHIFAQDNEKFDEKKFRHEVFGG